MEPPRNPWEKPWRNERRLETSHTVAQAPEATENLIRQKICDRSSILAGNFPFPICSLIPADNRWAGACEQWWLYWMFLTATSRIVSCINSLLLERDTQEIIRTCCNQHLTDTNDWSQCDNGLPCSSLTVHTIRSTQAAFAWQRSLRGLCSTDNAVESRSTRCSSDWLLLNCSSTKSCTSRTNDGGRAKKHQASELTANTVSGLDEEYLDAIFTFHVVQSVPQHFKHAHVEGVTERFVVEVDSRICLNKREKKPIDKLISIKPFPFSVVTSITSVRVASRLFKKDSETNFFTYKLKKHTRTCNRDDVGSKQTWYLWREDSCTMARSFRSRSTGTSTSFSPSPKKRGDIEKLELTVEK